MNLIKLNYIQSSYRIMNTTPQSERSAIESIVRELEKIPEPMQLSLLDFIRSLGNSYTATNQAEI